MIEAPRIGQRLVGPNLRRGAAWVAAASALALLTEAPRVWSQEARAQVAAAPASPREWFQRGLAALDAGRFDDAIRAFERSYEMRPSPVVLYNLGLALRGAGRIREAVATLDRFVRQPSEGTSQRELAAVATEVDRLQRQLATIELDVAPRAARVVMDAGETLSTRGRALADPGTHTFSISLDGYRTETRSLTLARGRSAPLVVQLEPVHPGPRIQVEPDVANATVVLDDHQLGRGTVDAPTTAGAHTVIVRAPGYREVRRQVTIASAGSTRLVVSMQRDGGISPLAIGLAAGGVVFAAVVVAGTVAAVSTAPRVYQPSPGTNPGWLGNTLERAAP
ncbi:MAG: PEGA domain-containing protein [Myxococcales bacterium]|nr:PEGA domain-containing protein [Myxococcales bacterium]